MDAADRFLRLAVLCAMMGVLACSENPTESQAQGDTEKPVIDLGSVLDTITIGDPVPSTEVECIDDTDGDLSDSVVVSGRVDSLTPGTHTLTYSVSDQAGNTATVERVVVVEYPPALFAFYPFDGDARDESGRGHHGTVSGAVPCADRFGNAESAYRFDGTDDHIIADSLFDLPSGNTAKTVVGWFRTSEASGSRTLFGVGTAVNQKNFQIAWGPSGYISGTTLIRVNGWGNSYDWRSSLVAAMVGDGKWHHIGVTYDSTTTRLYLDGELIDETSEMTYTTDSATARVVIGVEADGDGWAFMGELDDVMIYTRALTDTLIKALYLTNGWESAESTDTTQPPSDTTSPPDPPPSGTVTGLTHTIEGSSGNLRLILSWDAVPGAFAYGVYYDEGTSVDENGYYRVAMNNEKTFTSDLTEGKTYTFAVIVADSDGTHSPLSEPYTATFEAP